MATEDLVVACSNQAWGTSVLWIWVFRRITFPVWMEYIIRHYNNTEEREEQNNDPGNNHLW